MKRLLLICSVTMLLAAGACSTSQTAKPLSPPNGDEFMDAFNDGDVVALAEIYTEDAAIFPPGAVRIDGRQNIGQFWQGAIDAGFANLILETLEVEIVGNTSYDVGTLSLDVPGENGELSAIAGKFIVVWKYGGDGQWRMHRDIWNLDPVASGN